MTAHLNMGRRAKVLRLPTAGPSDTAPLAAAIDRGEIDPATIVAIVGKTEGNGCVNDFTRGYATLALKLLLAERLKCPLAEVEARVAIVMSGGTEGGLSPLLLVFCRESSEAAASGPRLAIGVGLTRAFKPEEIGRRPQIDATAEAVASAMKDAGIASASDVHFVQIKCPLLTKERIEEAERRGASVATEGRASLPSDIMPLCPFSTCCTVSSPARSSRPFWPSSRAARCWKRPMPTPWT